MPSSKVSERPPLLVVDAPSVLFRAFYALPKSIKGKGDMPVNALLGSVNIVLQEVLRHGPRAVVLCFGAEAAHYRVDLYSGYHADRPELLPDELEPQWDAAPGLYEALDWQSIGSEEVEADDLLGSFARAEAAAGGRSLILTGDRDLFQCADGSCSVLYLKTGGARGAELVDADDVRRRYGVPPELVPDFIALRGDPSDGLPGAPGVGEKTAADLLRRHGSLEGAIAAALGERPRLRGALRDNADELRTFKEIATLRDVPVERPPDAPTNFVRGAEAARSLGMNGLADRLEKLAATRGRTT